MAKQKTNRLVWGLAPILTGGLTLPGVSAPVTPADAPVGAQRPSAAKDSGKAPRHVFRSEEGWIETFHRTPLMLAACSGNVGRVKALLAQGAAVNARDNNGMTALMWAPPEVGLLLLQRGAGTMIRDHFGRTPLHFAAFSGAYSGQSLITALLGRGVAIDARDDQGWTPLHYAVYAELRYWDLGPFPRERDAPLIAIKTEQPWALPSLNVEDAVRAGNDPIHTLLQHGATVNAADADGWTPLILALKHWEGSDSPVLQALLAKGANVNARSTEGLTPLLACANSINNTSTLMLLLDRGAELNAEDVSGYTALTWAANAGDLNMVKFLVARGADVNGGRGTGPRVSRWTPLMAATACRNKEMVQFLIQKGADVNRRSSDGWTAYKWTQTMTAGTPVENAALKIIGEILKQAGAEE